jgi:hypothetical protein
VIKARLTSSENRKFLEHTLVLCLLDPLVDETSSLVGNKND